MKLLFGITVLLSLFAVCYCSHLSDPCGNAATQGHSGDIAFLVVPGTNETYTEGEMDEERERRAATSRKYLLWDGGIVIYTLANSFSNDEKRLIYSAMKQWEDNTCIRFKKRTTESSYLRFFPGSGCCSYVGKVSLNQLQGVSIGRGCMWIPTILHEIGHAVGFWHEQSRPDRDDYVDILYENIRNGYEFNFHELDDSDTDSLGVGYDYNSIMHYSQRAFSRDYRLDTIRAKDPNIPIGMGYELSDLDILQANKLYNCDPDNLPPPMVTVPPTSPSPTSAPIVNAYSCGALLLDVDNGSIHSPGYQVGNYISNTNCGWYIRGPAGYKLQVTFTNFRLDYSQGCPADYVQIIDKHLDPLGQLSPKICGFYLNPVVITTTGNFAVVRYRTDSVRTDSLAIGFAANFEFIDIDECDYLNGYCSHNCDNHPGAYSCSCRDGFFLSADGYTCFDVNECALEKGGCEHTCVNKAGYHYCTCKTGYVLQADGRSCSLPGDSCIYVNGGCEHTCTDSPDGVVCSCREGYGLRSDGTSCGDVDECTDGTHKCDRWCANTEGSYSCSCSFGFSLNSDGHTCDNIDECARGWDVCQDTCLDTVGDYLCNCSEGLKLASNGWSCDDVDECAEGTHDCSHTCSNRYGSYLCGCPAGYTIQGPDYLTCADLDECSFNRHDCNTTSGAECVNTIGSYNCSCPQGYLTDQTRLSCIDADECQESNQGCEHICVNTEGSFTCSCQPGYLLGLDGVSCNDTCGGTLILDSGGFTSPNWPHAYPSRTTCQWTITVPEPDAVIHFAFDSSVYGFSQTSPSCQDNVEIFDGLSGNASSLGMFCGRNIDALEYQISSTNQAQVVFTSGSNSNRNSRGFSITYRAVKRCSSGYQRTIDGLSCEDIDECTTQTDGCEVHCHNTNGSFECSCNEGYLLGQDGKTCDDTNECLTANGGCEQVCSNTDGSFTCSCQGNEGYFLESDAKSCHHCGGNFTEETGNFSTPSILEGDPSNPTCTWIVMLPDPNKVIHLSISDPVDHRAGTGALSSCPNDWLEIIDGAGGDAASLGQYCYGSVPESILLSSSHTEVVLKSSDSANMQITYRSLSRCEKGYSRSSSELKCLDEDECAIANGGCEGVCTNTNGSFECGCNHGFQLGIDGKSCDDVDECLSDNGGCDEECTNTHGSFTCSCLADSGLYLDVDGRSCLPCGGNLSELTGSFGSPYWPKKTYPTDLLCTWVISIPHQDMIIRFTFDDIFAVAGKFPTCPKDWVEIRDGATADARAIGRYCHLKAPPPIITSGSEAMVVFKSGPSPRHRIVTGFKLNYQTVNVTEACGLGYRLTQSQSCEDIDECVSDNGGCEWECSNTRGSFVCSCDSRYHLAEDGRSCTDDDECLTNNGGCGHNCTNTDGLYNCSCAAGYKLASDEHSCLRDAGCGGVLTEASGTFQSPHWPSNYPAGIYCVWSIELSDPDKAIKFVFNSEYYGIEGSPPSCESDWVEILNGGGNDSVAVSVGQFCGNQAPPVIYSSTNVAMVIFQAVSGFQNTSGYNRGFQVNYQTVNHPQGFFGCNVFIQANQPFGPPSFPELIQRDDFSQAQCTWRFIGSNGVRVRFRLLYFDIPENNECSQDSLKVYNGLFGHRPLLANLCGKIQQFEFQSSGPQISVVLDVSSYNSYRGFHGVFEVL